MENTKKLNILCFLDFVMAYFFKKIQIGNHRSFNIHLLGVGYWIFIFCLFIVLPQGCTSPKEVVFTGRTMGTTYHIKLVAGYFERTSGLQSRIDEHLESINQSMSTYIHDSEISRFNRSGDTREAFGASDDFMRVMRVAQKLHVMTDGAWDGTIKPLVDLWGFGSRKRGAQLPGADTIDSMLKTVGFDRIDISSQGGVRKKHPSVTLDFASIAKGYAVDQIALLLKTAGIENFIVEIGGEVYASGVRQDGEKWRVGVNLPSRQASDQEVYSVIPLSNLAMATSGDYRIFFEKDGIMYSHILDPRTGYPVRNGVASVTVIAADCTFADGLATAVMVMGPDKGRALIERLPGVEGLIIVRNADTEMVDHTTSGFAAMTQ